MSGLEAGGTAGMMRNSSSLYKSLVWALFIDNDLDKSCGLGKIQESFPEVCRVGGNMGHGNYWAATDFGYEPGKQGI